MRFPEFWFTFCLSQLKCPYDKILQTSITVLRGTTCTISCRQLPFCPSVSQRFPYNEHKNSTIKSPNFLKNT